MKKYQEKITSLIESGAYNEAAQLFCNETGTKIYIYFKGWAINKLWKENFSRPKYTVIIKKGSKQVLIMILFVMITGWKSITKIIRTIINNQGKFGN